MNNTDINKDKKANKRPEIPTKVRLQVWSAAAGRCSFRGCNKKLWYDGLTLSSGNFGELAHIIGVKEKGPRGNSDSESLVKNPSNIMLVCQEHHKMLDDNPQTYTVGIIRKMKAEHEYRINQVTSITAECKTEILVFKANIGKRSVEVDFVEAKRTIIGLGFYPASNEGILIDRTREEGDGEDAHWQYNREKIEKDMARLIELKGNLQNPITHLSVFALGPIPYLMLLGKLLTDTQINKIEVFQRDRSAQSWEWPTNIDLDNLPKYQFEAPIKTNSSCEPVLILALSDHIKSDKYEGIFSSEQDIYTITLKDAIPNREYCQHPSLVTDFVKLFHQTINELQSIYGVKTKLHLLSAIPNSVAVRCGMALLPKKEMPILVYDFNHDYGFRPIFLI